MLEVRSRFLAKQTQRNMILASILMEMFSAKVMKPVNSDYDDNVNAHVNFDYQLIIVDFVIASIGDQKSFTCKCHEELEVGDQFFAVKNIGLFAIRLTDRIQNFKAKRHNINVALDMKSAPKLLTKLIRLRGGILLERYLMLSTHTSQSFDLWKQSKWLKSSILIWLDSTIQRWLQKNWVPKSWLFVHLNMKIFLR